MIFHFHYIAFAAARSDADTVSMMPLMMPLYFQLALPAITMLYLRDIIY
jgi:hypothetical protein